MHPNMSMSDKSYSGYGYNRAQGCGCGGQFYPMGGCTLAAPMPYVPACHPAPFSIGPCQSSKFFNLSTAYGRM